MIYGTVNNFYGFAIHIRKSKESANKYYFSRDVVWLELIHVTAVESSASGGKLHEQCYSD